MWRLVDIECPFRLAFSDGEPIGDVRGGNGTSYRLHIEQQGILDLTESVADSNEFLLLQLDANGARLIQHERKDDIDGDHILQLFLSIRGDGTFCISLLPEITGIYGSNSRDDARTVKGKLLPFPEVSMEDGKYVHEMIRKKYMPYGDIPDAPGKTHEEIRIIGERYFPFSPCRYQLAMCLYDWTTASFMRLVLMKVFEYTNHLDDKDEKSRELPPLDLHSIAEQIWLSNWSPYTPQDHTYMRSFLMRPSCSLLDVELQLLTVRDELHRFSDIENRVLLAALRYLPRTSTISKPRLFSGQVDIRHMGSEHFGVEFLECPRNKGPLSEPLQDSFENAISTYAAVGKTVTTKMVWSFTSSAKDAFTYSNGILLVANKPKDSWAWEGASYVTPFSTDLKKIEYTFMAGTKFVIQSIEKVTVRDREVTVINLQPTLGEADISYGHQPKDNFGGDGNLEHDLFRIQDLVDILGT